MESLKTAVCFDVGGLRFFVALFFLKKEFSKVKLWSILRSLWKTYLADPVLYYSMVNVEFLSLKFLLIYVSRYGIILKSELALNNYGFIP